MADQAWAIEVSEDNLGVIFSEAGGKLEREAVKKWLEAHGEGYFLRDESSVLDCSLFAPYVFFEMYIFKHQDSGALIREVVKV